MDATIDGGLEALDDAARLRALPCDPPLGGEAWTALRTGLAKLFAQFAREGRIEAWGCSLAAGGSVLVIAWRGGELSGCSHDALNRLLLAHERDGRLLLSAPPLVVEIAGTARCVDRPGLRELVSGGQAGPATMAYDLRVPTLGDWRSAGRLPLERLHGGRWLPRAPG